MSDSDRELYINTLKKYTKEEEREGERQENKMTDLVTSPLTEEILSERWRLLSSLKAKDIPLNENEITRVSSLGTEENLEIILSNKSLQTSLTPFEFYSDLETNSQNLNTIAESVVSFFLLFLPNFSFLKRKS